MTYILLCILMNVLIYVNFRCFPKLKINTVQAIIINYFFCVIASLFFQNEFSFGSETTWIPLIVAFLLGVFFIVNFILISKTTAKMGISVASIATKLSLIIPVLVSLLFIQSQFRVFDFFNYSGIFLALPALALGSLQKQDKSVKGLKNINYLILPFIIFFLSGAIDAVINLSNYYLLKNSTEALFIITIFSFSSITGICYLIYRNERIKIKNVIAGFLLAVPNYFALWFLIKSLSVFENDGSLVYPSVNIGIILLASLVSLIFFKDHLSFWNKIGIILSVFSIFLIYHQEILNYFSTIL